MILLLDIGNSSTSWALTEKKTSQPLRFYARGFIDTHPLMSLGQRIRQEVNRDQQRLKLAELKSVLIGSVVRGATPVIEKNFLDVDVKRLGPIDFTQIKNSTREPEKVGVDRLLNIIAAVSQFSPPLVVVDTGTAITLDVVVGTADRPVYLGGVIMPGLKLSRDVLNEKTSLLPSIELEMPERAIGDTTESAMAAGIVLGAACSIQGLFSSITQELSQRHGVDQQTVHLIGTGGQMPMLAEKIPSLQTVNLDLTLQGLWEMSGEK